MPKHGSPRFETVIVVLAGDPAIPKLQKYRGAIAHLAVRWEVLNLHRGNANPVHLQGNANLPGREC